MAQDGTGRWMHLDNRQDGSVLTKPVDIRQVLSQRYADRIREGCLKRAGITGGIVSKADQRARNGTITFKVIERTTFFLFY
jgi:hypothetical protein